MRKIDLKPLSRTLNDVITDTERLHYLLHHGAGFLLTREQQEEVTKLCDRLILDVKAAYSHLIENGPDFSA